MTEHGERLARLETHVAYLVHRVGQNSEILDRLDRAAIADKARSRVLAKVAGFAGSAGGLAGSGIGWLVAHGYLKVPLTALALVLAMPAPAGAAEARFCPDLEGQAVGALPALKDLAGYERQALWVLCEDLDWEG